MKIFSPRQIRLIEEATFNHPTHPVSYLALMEDAGTAFSELFLKDYSFAEKVTIFCGTGNNGGDGLVVARLLSLEGVDVTVVLVEIGEPTDGYLENLKRLPSHGKVEQLTIQEGDDLVPIFQNLSQSDHDHIIIDALFGIGINRPITGYWADLIEEINAQQLDIVALDIPSGLFITEPSEGVIIKATTTYTFNNPKLCFFFPENEEYIGEWDYADLPLDEDAIASTPSNIHVISYENLPVIPTRPTFSHKGTFGNALIVAGQYGMAGAALLATKAALRSGTGKVTVLTPSCNQTILQLGAPEAVLLPTTADRYLASMSIFTGIYSAIGIGPGLGKHADTVKLLRKLCKSNASFVLDADAINILSENPDILESLPKNSILTPHPKEFERLVGPWRNGFERIELQKAFSRAHGIFIVYKNAHTCITLPSGKVFFNITGNPGMAKGGTGDILLGYLTGLLARGLSPTDACLVAVYLHGLAGDAAAEEKGMESMKAGDLLDWL